MVAFIIRRLGVSVLTLLAASFLMYLLAASSVNPLEDLEASNNPNKVNLIAARTQLLQLDVPPPLRWVLWLSGAAKCLIPFANACDLGSTISRAEVTDLLPQAVSSTVQLVTLALILAVLFGVALGIITALRQYSGLDNTVSFLSFFLYSLPAFLVAVLLKVFIAIGFNDFLADPKVPVVTTILVAVVLGLIVQSVVGGQARRRLAVGVSVAVASAVVLAVASSSGWFLAPALGIVGVLILCAATAIGVVSVIAGLGSRRSLLIAGINALVAVIAYLTLQNLFDISSVGTIVILAVATLAVGVASGLLLGGYDRIQGARIGGIVALLCGGIVVLDRFLQSWPDYLQVTRQRPIATAGSTTPGFTGDMWLSGLDSFAHLLLPTIALLLITFASYTRYARAGMLEVLNLDFVRTARAKGLPERTVVVQHAFRNMLIPITTLIAFDVGALLGGAVITEFVFAIPGMGSLFNASLQRGDLNPVMGYFVIVAAMAILFNFVADLAYAGLDPRVRVL